ncbi:MAG: M20/M25/M40 family metallo-hydrolase [Bacteroidia bacterium]|nr:M20/M25/M40 family metallo-hydrolase [Bacteroidia bacterium]
MQIKKTFSALLFYSVFCCIIFLNLFPASGQDIKYAKQVLAKLCSEDFHGRGYTNNGDFKAAKFIAAELKNIKASKISKSYFQEFYMPVCTISDLGILKIDSDTLNCGTDFVIYPGSKSCSGKFPLFRIDKQSVKDLYNKNLIKSFIVIDTSLTNDKSLKEIISEIRHKNPMNAKGIITLVAKNTVQVEDSEQRSWVQMEITCSSFPENAKEILLSFKSNYIEKYKTRNVIAVIPGKSDSIIAFSAHYDHLGELGNAFFPGANDNASGVTMLLDLCKTFSKEKPRYTIVFMFFTGEEIGLVGSQYFVSHPLVELKKIKFLLNMDLLGSGEDGITVVNGSVFKTEFELLKELNNKKNYVPVVKVRGASDNSDHAPFYHSGVKCFFIYAQGKTGPYHNPADTPENLSLGKYEELTNLMIDFVNNY